MKEEDKFIWTVRLKTDKKGISRCFTRQHEFRIGEALSFDSEYENVSALEHVLGAIAADILSTIRKLSRKKRIEVEELEAVIESELENPLVYLQVIGENGSTAIKKVSLKVYISSFGTEEEVAELWKETLHISPLVQTFQKSVKLNYEYKLVL